MYGAGEDEKWHPILFFTFCVEKPGDRQRTSVLEPEFHEMTSRRIRISWMPLTAGAFRIPPKFTFLLVLCFAVHFSVRGTYKRVAESGPFQFHPGYKRW